MTLRRVFGQAWLALAITLFGVLPVAEARVMAESSNVVAHVEAPDAAKSCAPVHDHWSCPTCRALRFKPRAEEPWRIAIVLDRAGELRADERIQVGTHARDGAARPRAPPAGAA